MLFLASDRSVAASHLYALVLYMQHAKTLSKSSLRALFLATELSAQDYLPHL